MTVKSPQTVPIAPHWQRIIGLWFGVWAISLVALTGAFIQYAWLSVPTASAALVQEDGQLFTLTNQVRHQAGLADLVMDDRLTAAAAAKAHDMLNRHYFGHFYGQTTPWQFIDASGYHDWHWAGENLAKNYLNPDVMVQAWLNSPTHRANLLSEHYSRTGIATVKQTTQSGEQIVVTVQLFTGS